ncbi:MAG: DUF418 domain-containing protein [Aureispira sp.]|nr:DUF418 domain-containing protein [Aureispira sp.]
MDKKKRILGIDLARALAVFGMIVVNFKIVFGMEGESWLKPIAGLLEGKAAATFVFLAGVGIALMSNKAVQQNDLKQLKVIRKRILKRALFLGLVGLSYIVIWPADILHFYGVYLLFALVLLQASQTLILSVAIGLIFSYPILMGLIDYEQGWNFETLAYVDFWSFEGFFRNLFYNGFHPVLPWAAFMLVGLWFGRMDLRDTNLIKKALKWSLFVFILAQCISWGMIELLSIEDPSIKGELKEILCTSPMPPLPIYMISGSSIAICTLCCCVLLANRFTDQKWLDALVKTGQLALTFYIAHVVLGMGLVDAFGAKELGAYPIGFSIVYAFVFCIVCVLFAVVWRQYKKIGPVEWLMRKLTN